MNKEDRAFMRGVGVAVHYAFAIDDQFAERLFRDLNLPLSEYEDACDRIDLPYIRKVAN